MRTKKDIALQIYKFSQEYGMSEDLLIGFDNITESEYREAIKEYLKSPNSNTYDSDFIEQKNREFEEATFNEYFDWARTYRYALWR